MSADTFLLLWVGAATAWISEDARLLSSREESPCTRMVSFKKSVSEVEFAKPSASAEDLS